MKRIPISLICLLCISSFLFLEPISSFAAKDSEEKNAEPIEKPVKKQAAPKKQKVNFVGVRRP